MSEMKYTPGPWITGLQEADGPVCIGTAEGTALFKAIGAPGPHNQANAELAAAAPDMFEALEACERIIRVVAIDASESGTLKKVRHALSKARGGSQ